MRHYQAHILFCSQEIKLQHIFSDYKRWIQNLVDLVFISNNHNLWDFHSSMLMCNFLHATAIFAW